MGRIEDLVHRMCPKGVPFRKLSELGTFYSGLSGKSKKDFTDGNACFISYKNIYSNPALDIHPSDKVHISIGEKQNIIQYGDILFTGSSETPDECAISSVVCEEPAENLYLNSFCFGLRPNSLDCLFPGFLKHYFRCRTFRAQAGRCASGVTRYNVSKKLLAEVEIPVPPLSIQKEIASILDNFSELTAELTARKQQYDYYRNQLLTFYDKPEMACKKLINLLCQPITDGPHTTPQFYEEGIPFISVDAIWDGMIHFENKRGYISIDFDKECSKKYKPQRGDVFMVKSGSTTGKVAYVDTDTNFNIWSPLAAMRANVDNSPRFLYHILQTDYIQEQVRTNASQGSQPNLSMRVLEQFDVFVPPLAEQERIASILDRFDVLVNGLSDGLPAEIDCVRKQYEYYCDKLLTFKRATM